MSLRNLVLSEIELLKSENATITVYVVISRLSTVTLGAVKIDVESKSSKSLQMRQPVLSGKRLGVRQKRKRLPNDSSGR